MTHLKSLVFLATAGLLGLASTSLLAHAGENHEAQKPANGGQVRVAGGYHFELVVAKDNREVKDSPVVIHVTDQAGKKVQTAGASGTATILAGRLKSTVTLVPDGDNRLKGAAKYASTPDMKVVVSIGLPGTPAEQARFTPFAAAPGGI